MLEILESLLILLSAPWLWLILIASVMYAAGNYIDELLIHDYEQEIGTLVIISSLFGIVVAGFFFCVAPIFEASILLDTPLLYQALAVGVLEVLWVIPYLYATERSGAIVAGPLFQAVPVFALGFESMLGTTPPTVQLIGAAIIVLGGIILSIEKEEAEDGIVSRSVNWGTIIMMSVSAIIVSLIYVLFRDAALETDFVAVGFWTGIGSFLTGICIYLLWRPYRHAFNTFCKHANYEAVGVQIFNEFLDAGGAYMTNIAGTLGPSVMVVTAFNATQPIAVGIIGAILSAYGFVGISSQRAETGGWLLIATGILLIAVGVIIVALGINE